MIQHDQLAVTCRDVEAATIKGQTTAPAAIVLKLGRDIEVPQAFAGIHIKCRDLGISIQGKDPAQGDNGLGNQLAETSLAFTNALGPDLIQRPGGCDVMHDLVDQATILRPVRRLERRRKNDRLLCRCGIGSEFGIELQHGDTVTGQRWRRWFTQPVK